MQLASANASGLVTPGGCQYYEGESKRAPFTFYHRLANGSAVEVQPEADASGLCVFPQASCGGEYEDFQCCTTSEWVEDRANTARNMNTIVCNVMVGVLVLAWILFIRWKRRKAAREEAQQQQAGQEPEADQEAPGCTRQRIFMIVGLFLFFCVVGVEVALSLLVAKWTQQKLSVSSRNALLATDAFLIPVREIFQFLEDAVTVKINLAIGAGRPKEARAVLLMGILGGAVLGSLAASLITGICFWPAVIDWLVAPYKVVDASLHCSFSSDISSVVDEAKPYILARAWQWPFAFVNMALRGYLLGSKQWVGIAVLGVVEQGLNLLGMICIFLPHPSLIVLGLIGLAGSASATVTMLGMLGCSNTVVGTSESRESGTPGPSIPMPVTEASEDEEDEGPIPMPILAREKSASMKTSDAIREGAYAMVLDLSVQTCRTLGIYIVGSRFGMGAMYQISTLESAFPQFGLQYIVGLTVSFRIGGPQLVAQRRYGAFSRFFAAMLAIGGCVAVAGAATLLPYKDALSFDLAQNACRFATQPNCLPIYALIFGGGRKSMSGTALQDASFTVFVPALLAVCLYRMLKAGLYACLDWGFMAIAAAAAFVGVFVPSILVATLVYQDVTAVFVAMYLPVLALAVGFALRIHHNVRKMKLDEDSESLDTEEESSESSSEG